MLDHAESFRAGITAVFSQTDIMALGAIEGLWDSGLQVPRDVAIVSYDDIGFGKDFRPRLTTVHQPRDRLAVAACRRLRELLDAPRSSTRSALNAAAVASGEVGGAALAAPQEHAALLQRRVQPYLVVRESCGAERRENAVAEKSV